MTLNTRRKFPLTSFSRAVSSPSCICLKSNLISSFFNTGSFDVSTPQISTLFRVNPFPSLQELLYKKQYFPCKEKYAPVRRGRKREYRSKPRQALGLRSFCQHRKFI